MPRDRLADELHLGRDCRLPTIDCAVEVFFRTELAEPMSGGVKGFRGVPDSPPIGSPSGPRAVLAEREKSPALPMMAVCSDGVNR